MKDIFCLVILLAFFSACRQESSPEKENDSDSSDGYAIQETTPVPLYDTVGMRNREGTYEYVYPDNTEDLIENHYIKLILEPESLIGKYYGTTDEFDEAREGYLPGFFVADLYDLQIQDDSIKFVILCSDEDFFTKPIDLKIQNSDEARKQGYVTWDVKLRTNMKKYSGFIQGDTILIKDALNDRLYLRVE